MGGHSQTKNFPSMFDAWKSHCNGNRTNTDLVTMELLRETHPDYHVTRSNCFKSDLLAFAEAGFATAVADDDEAWDSMRTYKEPASRLTDEPGKLVDSVNFGRWRYEWDGRQFLFYQLQFKEISGAHSNIGYILSPRPNGVARQRNHPASDELLMAVGLWGAKPHEEVYVFDEGRWYKDQVLFNSVKKASWDEVILEPRMKANLIKDVQAFFDNQALYKKLGVPWKRGLILHGTPGNGKTMSIKALMSSLASRPAPVPSLYVKSFDSRIGPKRAIRSIFEYARTFAPCLLIFEDLDSLVDDKVRSYFLNEVDGLESNNGILMLGSTNHLGKLDPAIAKRPSRFDRKYHFKIPGEAQRIEYAEMWQRNVVDNGIVDFPIEMCGVIAKMTAGFTFAYLKELFVMTLLGVAHPDEAVEDLAESSNGSSAADEVMVDLQEGTAKDEGDAKSQVMKRVPRVDIPESLRENQFLKALQTQAQQLFDEMDNTLDLE